MTIYYVIRQKTTGFFFPATGRGSTHAEFSEFGSPRLFRSRTAAKNCLTYWLKGVTRVIRTGGSGWDNDYDERWQTTPDPSRKGDDYEIVTVKLKVVLERNRA